jgi:hypothetical protein
MDRIPASEPRYCSLLHQLRCTLVMPSGKAGGQIRVLAGHVMGRQISFL